MTPAMQAARDRVVEAARLFVTSPHCLGTIEWCEEEHALNVAVFALLALEAKEQADAED